MARDAAGWLREIAAAKKRDEDYRKEGARVLEIYSGKKKNEVPFNILFSNTETLLPALYSATPRPDVSRRFKDSDPIAKASASASDRGLTFLLDTNVEGYETFDEAMTSAVLDSLLPGRGLTTIKYDFEEGQLPTESVDDEVPAAEDAKKAPAEPETYKKSELVCCDARSWNKYHLGYAKKWSKVPWIAYEEQVDRAEATRIFGETIAAKLVYTAAADDEAKEEGKSAEELARGEAKTATIYQVWDKEGGRKVHYVSAQVDEILKTIPDPLGLTGFFNCPKPLSLIAKSNDLTPTAPYLLYENQAKELNDLTTRISKIIAAVKARGIYDAALGADLENLFAAAENEFIPSDKTASIAAEGGIDKAIWFMPVEKLIEVLRELYAARESCKQVIFEIMGLADIMRGASQASETLGAQQIKQSWSSLRLRRTQKEVQRYARDILRLMLEVAATKFSEETWARMTGLPYLTAQQAAQQVQILKAAQMQPQNPQAQQAAQAAQQALQQPKWADVIGVLRDDLQRAYRVDIETNSTVQPEAVEDQKNIADVMTALGQFLNGVSPLVQSKVMPFQAAQAMMLSIVRRFRFGDEIEEYLQQMQAPTQQDDGKAAAAQAAQQAEQMKHQREQEAEKNRAAEANAKIASDQAIATAKANATAQSDAAQAMEETKREAAKLATEERQKQRELAFQERMEKARLESDNKRSITEAALKGAIQIEVARIGAAAKGGTPEDPATAGDATEMIAGILSGQDVGAAFDMRAQKTQASGDRMERLIQTVAESHKGLMASHDNLVKVIAAPTDHIRDEKTGRVKQSRKVLQ